MKMPRFCIVRFSRRQHNGFAREPHLPWRTEAEHDGGTTHWRSAVDAAVRLAYVFSRLVVRNLQDRIQVRKKRYA